MNTDVLVVGGGIGGAVLALALGRRGWRIRILEREPAPPSILRPEILQESTLSALEALDVGARLRRDAALPLHHLEVLRGDEHLLRVGAEDLAAARIAPHSTDPARTRAMIVDAALATGNVELVRGAEVTDLAREGERVVGVRGRREGEAFEARARLVVGDDGVRSTVRGGLGIRIGLRLFPMEFVTFELPRPRAIPPDVGRAWIDPGALRHGVAGALFLPLPEDRLVGTLIVPLGIWEERFQDDPDAFWKSVSALTPLGARMRDRLRFPDDFRRTRRSYGHAVSYVGEGAALIGDAAHPMSPAGGQGANASVWDAIALAEVADAALRDDDLSLRRLLEYERRRWPANSRSLRYTRRAVALLRLGRWLPAGGWLLTSLLRQAGRDTLAKRRVLRQVGSAFLDAGPPA